MPLDALTQSPYRTGGIVNMPEPSGSINPFPTSGFVSVPPSASSFLENLTEEELTKRLSEIEREARALRVLLQAVQERDKKPDARTEKGQ